MNYLRVAPVALAVLTVGCTQLSGKSNSCSGPDASAVTLEIVRDGISKIASEQDEGEPSLSKSKVRATVRQLALTLEDVRTTKDDPNSTKQFCTGSVKLVAPADMVSDANQAREMVGLNSVEDMADNANVEANANSFTAEIDFNVQPTDDGDKIYSQVENGDEAIGFFAELVKSHLLKSAIADAKAEQDRITAEQEAATASAEREAAMAALEEAAAENQMAINSINAIWKAIPAETRSELLEVQKAWVRRKDAACRLEAANGATSEEEIKLGRLRCDTREQNSRADSLRRYAMQAIEQDYTYNGM